MIMLEAHRLSNLASAGFHGRRRAGVGENFWQFRPFSPGEPTNQIDWRRSARHLSNLFIREREWETPHAIFLWIDRSKSMNFLSGQTPISKIDRALIIGLAMADWLVRSGESVGLIDLVAPTSSRKVIDLFAEALVAKSSSANDVFPKEALKQHDKAILISDFLAPADDIKNYLTILAAKGATGHLLHILDPAEMQFPFSGQVEIADIESTDRLKIGDADQFRDTYHSIMKEHNERLEKCVHKIHWSIATHITNTPASAVMRDIAIRMAAA
jgi:uncharacterized protein (DUF58 family)